MTDFVFSEIVHNGAMNRGHVEQVESILLLDYNGQNVIDAYSSVYLHSQDYQTYTDPQGTKRGYSGAVKAEYLHFDFDSPGSDQALVELRRFTEKLCGIDKYSLSIDNFRFFFSGNKGFHVLIITDEITSMQPGEGVPDKVKKLCMHLAGEFKTFDKTVYDRTRIFRISNSKHGKTGLYKIPLLAGELWKQSMDEIKELAKKQRTLKIALKEWLHEPA
jgi:hypothetical protein